MAVLSFKILLSNFLLAGLEEFLNLFLWFQGLMLNVPDFLFLNLWSLIHSLSSTSYYISGLSVKFLLAIAYHSSDSLSACYGQVLCFPIFSFSYNLHVSTSYLLSLCLSFSSCLSIILSLYILVSYILYLFLFIYTSCKDFLSCLYLSSNYQYLLLSSTNGLTGAFLPLGFLFRILWSSSSNSSLLEL